MREIENLIKLKDDMNKFSTFVGLFKAERSLEKFNKGFEKTLKKVEENNKEISDKKFEKFKEKVKAYIVNNNIVAFEVLDAHLTLQADYCKMLRNEGVSFEKLYNTLVVEGKEKRYDKDFLRENKKYLKLLNFDKYDYFRVMNIKHTKVEDLKNYIKDYLNLVNDYNKDNQNAQIKADIDISSKYAKHCIQNIKYLNEEISKFEDLEGLKDIFMDLQNAQKKLNYGNKNLLMTTAILNNDKQKLASNEEYMNYIKAHNLIKPEEKERIIKNLKTYKNRFKGYEWWLSSNENLKYLMQYKNSTCKVVPEIEMEQTYNKNLSELSVIKNMKKVDKYDVKYIVREYIEEKLCNKIFGQNLVDSKDKQL